jgi:hypothetical protein
VDLVEIPADRKPVKSKWVFKTKRDEKGNVQRYKARLVAKGCSQRKGIDYEEVYSPVVRYASIRYLIALAVKYDLKIHQMDAVTAFLQGELGDEVIFMEQPEGFQVAGKKVCRLNKALYGLKQSSRVWNKKLDAMLKKIGLKESKFDPCIYYKIADGKMLMIAVYVDDFLIFGTDEAEIMKIKKQLCSEFKMKDLGEAKQCLGIRITREANQISLDQEKYIEEILERFGMSNCRSVKTPLDPNQIISSDADGKEEAVDFPYQEIIGSFMYLVQCTRPDLAYAVSSLSRFNKSPTNEHCANVKRVLRYLRGTSKDKLVFSKNGKEDIVGFSDANWASNPDDRRSVTGYVFKELMTSLVIYSRKK